MKTNLDTKRITVFLLIAFGIAWGVSLIIYLTGGMENSPEIIPGTPVTLALVLTAGLVMWAPALANILTRLITKEGWQNTYLRPHFKRGWPYWLAAWFLPGLLPLIGMTIFFLLFPDTFDSSLSKIQALIDTTMPGTEINPWVIVAAQTIQAILISPIVNGLFTFGEEFGWRGFLQQKLMPLGGRKAMIAMGVIWGVWHWPIILMGHNYGLEYPGAPILGPLAMVWFCFVIGTILGWATLKGGSVWPAVIGHAVLNGVASLGILFSQGDPNPILGPLPTGIIGGLGFTIVALLIFFSPKGLQEPAFMSKVEGVEPQATTEEALSTS